MPGAEVAVEALLRAGELEVLAVFDKPDPLEGPYFEETIYVTPSRLPAERLRRVDGAGRLPPRRRSACARGRCTPSCGSTATGRGCSSWRRGRSAASARGRCGSAPGISLEEVILRHALGLPLGAHARERAASGRDDAADRARRARCARCGGLDGRARGAGRAGRPHHHPPRPPGRPAARGRPLPRVRRSRAARRRSRSRRRCGRRMPRSTSCSTDVSSRAHGRRSPRTSSAARSSSARSALSPDGASASSTRGAPSPATATRPSLWLVPYAGGRPRRLTNGRWSDAAPAWSPDGERDRVHERPRRRRTPGRPCT